MSFLSREPQIDIHIQTTHLIPSNPTGKMSLSSIAKDLKLHFSITAEGDELISDVKLMSGTEAVPPVATLPNPQDDLIFFVNNDSIVAVHVNKQSPLRVTFCAAYMKGENSEQNAKMLCSHLAPAL